MFEMVKHKLRGSYGGVAHQLTRIKSEIIDCTYRASVNLILMVMEHRLASTWGGKKNSTITRCKDF